MTGSSESTTAAGTGWAWLAFAWGFAEAVFFFVVPDVLTSRLVLRDTKRGFVACVISLAGALIGGVILYCAGQSQPRTLELMDYVPGIGTAMIAQTRVGLEQQGMLAFFTGAFSGIPYKLYAVQAATTTGTSLGLFLSVSAAARLMRFGLVTAAAWVAGSLMPSVRLTVKLRIHAIAWTLFYAFYFWIKGI